MRLLARGSRSVRGPTGRKDETTPPGFDPGVQEVAVNVRLWASLALATMLVVVTGCDRLSSDGEDEATATPVATALPPVGAGGGVEAEGKVVPVRHAALGFPVGGTVAKVLVEEGDPVRAGQLLVRLDGSQQAAAVLLAQADLRAADARLAAAQAAAEELESSPTEAGAVQPDPTASELEAAWAGVDQAGARLEQALVLADQTRLVAPFGGTVAAVAVAPGEVVLPGATVLQLADDAAWLVETENLTEMDVVGVQVGDAVTIHLPALPDLELEGTIERVRLLGETRMGDVVYTVIVRPERHERRLRWNMTAEVRIAAEEEDPR